MQEMAEALGVAVVEVAGLTRTRWVADCSVLLLPAGTSGGERDEAIAWAAERMSAPAPS